MEFSREGLLSPDEVISEAAIFIGDRDMKKITKGFLMGQLRRCLNELAFRTFFEEVDVVSDIPANLKIKMPAGSFNIKEIYAYSGTSCEIGVNTVNVYWKRNFKHLGSGGYVSRNKANNQNDPFYGPSSLTNNISNIAAATISGVAADARPTNLYYYGISNGCIDLSASTGQFNKILIRYNGVTGSISDKPFIPVVLQDVCVDWLTESGLRARMGDVTPADLNRVAGLWNKSEDRLGYKPYHRRGSWYNAEVLLTSMDSNKQENLAEYLSQFNI